MDVTCERCRTAYEFDDALVSERGTTVKCTNCGHQFKVRRAEPLGAPERWLVRTIDGREIEFRALRELQAAIAQSLITRDDVLSRGGARPRRLGSIAELEPFFASAARAQTSAHSTVPGLGTRQRTPTPQGLGIVNLPPAGPRPSEVSVAIPLPKGIRDVIAGLPRDVINGLDDDTMVIPPGNAPRPAPGAPSPRAPTPVPPQARASAPVGTVVSSDGAPPLPAFDPETARYLKPPVPVERTPPAIAEDFAPSYVPPVVDAPPRPAPSGPGLLPGGYVPEVPLEAPAPAGVSRHPESSPFSSGRGSMSPMTPTPSMARASMRGADEGYNEPRFSSLAPPRRTGAARWIVGFVLVGMVALAFATVGRRYLDPSSAASGVVDERIVPLLQEGEKSLLDGDLDGAQEQFAKASVLGDKDPHVAADLARLAVVRADVAWLRVRVLPEGDADLGTAKRELEQAAERAQKASARASELAPSDAIVIRARMDAFRVSGDLARARALVSGVSAASAQPDSALALAQLDLAEDKPDWPTVLDRLRTALGGDQNLGRARSMLVYALARSGDGAAAKAELERLALLPRPHPLLRPLRAFVLRADASAPEASASARAGAKPSATAAVAAVPAIPGAPPTPPPRDKPIDLPKPPPDRPAGGNVPPSHPVDTSDLPGIKPPPRATTDLPVTPPPPPIVPPGVDTSDLPGFK